MTFFFQTNTIRVILKNVLALPSFIMAVNGRFGERVTHDLTHNVMTNTEIEQNKTPVTN